MKSKCAIVIPVYKTELTTNDSIALRHLENYLGDFPNIVIKPADVDFQLPIRFDVREFPAHHFTNISSYSKLLLSSKFYETFIEYDYILLYQLDSLVFSDDLQHWCEMEYDYIGAPLFAKNVLPLRLSRVGNGGFSLRRVQAFLEVLHSAHTPPWQATLTRHLPDLKELPFQSRWAKKLRVIREARRGVQWYAQNYSLNEDLFWSDRARLFSPEFKIAPLEVALEFAFDAHPRICYEQNHNKLPFGAHAWSKWDREFWEPYLLA